MTERCGNVLVLELTPVRARELLREICEDTARVFFTEHAEARMKERGITRTQVLRCLRHGTIIEGPARDIKGGWKLTMEVLSAGDVVRVVATLDHDDRGNLILVITTY